MQSSSALSGLPALRHPNNVSPCGFPKAGMMCHVEKLVERFPRTLANLAMPSGIALRLVFDNDDLQTPFRHVATMQMASQVRLNKPIPSWFKPLL